MILSLQHFEINDKPAKVKKKSLIFWRQVLKVHQERGKTTRISEMRRYKNLI